MNSSNKICVYYAVFKIFSLKYGYFENGPFCRKWHWRTGEFQKKPLIMRGSILPVTIPPPGTPPGKLGPPGPGVGNFLKRSCPGVGAGQIEITTHPRTYGVIMAANYAEKATFFAGKSIEYVSE